MYSVNFFQIEEYIIKKKLNILNSYVLTYRNIIITYL